MKSYSRGFVPDIVFKTGISLPRAMWSVSYQFSYSGQQFTDATNATFTDNAIDGLVPGYHVMDLTAGYRLNRLFYFIKACGSLPGTGHCTCRNKKLFYHGKNEFLAVDDFS